MVKKDLKLNIKNAQIAQAMQLDHIKAKLAAKKTEKTASKDAPTKDLPIEEELSKEESPKRKARSRSVFAEPKKEKTANEMSSLDTTEERLEDDTAQLPAETEPQPEELEVSAEIEVVEEAQEKTPPEMPVSSEVIAQPPLEVQKPMPTKAPENHINISHVEPPPVKRPQEEKVVLGPTGRHVKDLLVRKPYEKPRPTTGSREVTPRTTDQRRPPGAPPRHDRSGGFMRDHSPIQGKKDFSTAPKDDKSKKFAPPETPPPADLSKEKRGDRAKFKEFRDLKPAKKPLKGREEGGRPGLHQTGDDGEGTGWRKKRGGKSHKYVEEDLTIRPKELKVRLPISVKDLAAEMKLKASQLIQKLFLQGVIVTINDLLDDSTTIQLLGHEFECAIGIDASEEERIRITDQTIKTEILATPPEQLAIRAPVVAFMGHVDHGKTSLIDYIRSSSIASGEAGAITQHIGAFLCSTAVGDIAILDTPGHEAFSEMRARGADVTDMVVLVIAGDEGIRAQTEEAIQHAKAAGVTIVVAANKCDKQNFNIDNVYRQLADRELLAEAWGGTTIVVKTSATTGEGVKELLEMLALQAEVLELKASPQARARGTVLESELHKGLGSVATILVQNGTLKMGDALVFGEHWGRVKTMRDEFNKNLQQAGPSTPVEITGLSGIPQAGEEFIVVSSEKEAREIAEARMFDGRQRSLLLTKKSSLENLFQQAADKKKKVLKVVLRADVQGSLEAIRAGLMKIHSDKVEIDILSTGVGEISESDVLLAAASKAVIVGFHTKIESKAELLTKQHGVVYALYDIIYHAIDKAKDLMAGLLDKTALETEKGKAIVKAKFKASQWGTIAGCLVSEGTIHRSNLVRVRRKGAIVWNGSISGLKRVKEDVREVAKGVECGILLNNFNDVEEGDIIEAYEVTYISQEL